MGIRKFFRYLLPLGLIALSIVLVVVMVAIAKGKRPERRDTGAQAVLVDAIPAERTTLNLKVFSQGAVEPRTQTTLVAEVAGQIVSVSPNFISGGFFRQGEVLLQIDPSDYETGLLRAQANLASRRARYADEKARSEQALKDWTNLGREGEPSELVLRKPQLAEALAGVQAAEAELKEAERDLQRTRIRVPYDGLVRNKHTAYIADLFRFNMLISQGISLHSTDMNSPLVGKGGLADIRLVPVVRQVGQLVDIP